MRCFVAGLGGRRRRGVFSAVGAVTQTGEAAALSTATGKLTIARAGVRTLAVAAGSSWLLTSLCASVSRVGTASAAVAGISSHCLASIAVVGAVGAATRNSGCRALGGDGDGVLSRSVVPAATLCSNRATSPRVRPLFLGDGVNGMFWTSAQHQRQSRRADCQ